ncbi:MAG: hypothetical protein C0598_06110 [Marinilabiliales bacterium]|nr:MAG: hypothetical protein C0598_06110 [Marinilabiliales bacterium]
MADNLENFFKKHLSDETSGEDNWNIPSDNVFDKVLPEIQKESGLFVSWKNIILIVAGLLLTTLLIIFLLWNRNTNNNFASADSQDTIQTINNLNDQNSLYDTNENNDIINNETPSEESRELSNTDILNSEESLDIQRVETDNNNKVVYAGVDPKLKKNDNEQVVNYYSSEKNNLKATVDNTKIPVEPSTEISELEKFGSNLKMDILSIENAKNISGENMMREAPETSSLIEEPPYFNDKGKIGIGAFFTPTITSTYLTGDMIEGIENTSPVFLYSSNYGLELKYHFSNKIALVFGVGKSEIKSWSRSNIYFSYNSSTEQEMPNGDKSNTSDIPMPTPFGDVATSITYHFPGSAFLPDGELMQADMETHQTIQYLSIPFGIEYKLLGKSRLKWIVEGGFRFNKSVIDGSEFTSRILHEGQEMEVVGEQQNANPDFKDIYFNYYIGTGFNYRLRKNLQFNTSFRYLGNIDDVNLQNNMSTNVHEFNLKVGISFLF